MAITSAGGASFTRGHIDHGTGQPAPFTSQSYSGWIKIPSLGVERILFDQDGILIFKISALGNIQAIINGNTFTGSTVLPINKWINWSYKRTSGSNVQSMKVAWIDCINNIPILTSQINDINIVQATSGTPASFTWFVPAGCSVCGFKYSLNGGNVQNSITSWPSQGSSLYWSVVARFPNDMYDHREVSATINPTFHQIHDWTSRSGVVTLDANDPEILLDKICSAVIGISIYTPDITIAWPTNPIPPPINNQTFTVVEPAPVTILTDVLPSTAVLDGIKTGSYVIVDNVNITPGTEITPAADNAYWTYGANPTQFLETGALGSFGFYDWSYWASPNPQINNPSSGLPWTLSDLYGMAVSPEGRWGPFSNFVSPSWLRVISILELGISVTYFGQVTPPTCGGGPPPIPTGTIIVIKHVIQ